MVPAGGLLLAPAEGRNFAIRFKPASEAQQSYGADAVIASDENFRSMSEQVLGSKKVQKAILDLLAREFYGKHGRAGAA